MSAAGGYPATAPSQEPITEAMLLSLRKTRPWVRLVSILGILVSLFIIALGAGVGVVGPFLAKDKVPAPLMIGAGLFYIVLGILYIIPALYLFRYAAAISDALKVAPRGPSVERALAMQKSFWKFVGLFILITFFLYAVALVVGFLLAPGIIGTMMQNAM